MNLRCCDHTAFAQRISQAQGHLFNRSPRLFDAPPEGMSDRVFVAERTELSSQIRLRLGGSLTEVQTLAASFSDLEQKRADLRELNQQIKQLQQDRVAVGKQLQGLPFAA